MLYCRWGRNSFWGGRALTGEPQLAVVKADDSVLGVACHVLGESGHVDTRRIAENTSAQVLLLFIMFSLRCGGMLMYFLETPEKRVSEKECGQLSKMCLAQTSTMVSNTSAPSQRHCGCLVLQLNDNTRPVPTLNRPELPPLSVTRQPQMITAPALPPETPA